MQGAPLELWDGVAGHTLAADRTRQARAEELMCLEPPRVWETRAVAECWQAARGEGPIGGQWVDHNQGDSDNPKRQKPVGGKQRLLPSGGAMPGSQRRHP